VCEQHRKLKRAVVFPSAVELILGFIALKEGLIRVVQGMFASVDLRKIKYVTFLTF
jgi:Ca2+/H+ antiporter